MQASTSSTFTQNRWQCLLTDLTAAICDVKFYSSNPNITTDKSFLTAGGARIIFRLLTVKYILQVAPSWTSEKLDDESNRVLNQGYLTTILSEEANLRSLSPGIGWIGGSDQIARRGLEK